MATPSAASAQERDLLEAQSGSEDAYGRLVEPHRAELHAHCYRMLGSVDDADDALQDALLRAWRGLPRFEGRSSLRSWLYRIATNTCLDLLARRPKRVLPIDYGPPADPRAAFEPPPAEAAWLEPYPDEQLGLAGGLATPEARYEQRESVELAFIAALQHLPPNQRAVLILRDVLGFSAREAADLLETSVASVTSALQRARKTIDARLPEPSQQATLRSLGDDAVRDLVGRYVDAWERGDVRAVAALLSEDATFAMPPLPTWYRGREGIAGWMAGSSLSGDWRWRIARTRANGQPALGYYSWDPDAEAFLPFALNVLSLRGGQISDVTAFVVRSSESPDPEVYARWPRHRADPRRLRTAFERFGLPDRLD